MRTFCRTNIKKGVRYHSSKANTDTLYSFYVFTAAVDDGHSQPYGDNFAALIREAGLGDVWESPEVVNRAYHKDHKNKVWVWMPDREKIMSWWEENDPASEKCKAEALRATLKGWAAVTVPGYGYQCYATVQGFPHGCREAFVAGKEAYTYTDEYGNRTGSMLCLACWEKHVGPILNRLKELEKNELVSE
jgi:hypothetical protein